MEFISVMISVANKKVGARSLLNLWVSGCYDGSCLNLSNKYSNFDVFNLFNLIKITNNY